MSLEPSPITNIVLEYQRERSISVFPELHTVAPADFAALAIYADGTPERFANLEARAEVLQLLQAEASDNNGQLGEFFRSRRGELDIAFRELREVNILQQNDDMWPSFKTLEQISFIDRIINPSYLRLSEAVLSIFLLPFAVRERRLRQRSTVDIPLHQRIEEARLTQLRPYLESFVRTIRNAIAHGTVIYGALDITYADRRESLQISPRQMVRLHDSLLDTCNGLAASIRLFFLLEHEWIYCQGILPPLQMLLDEVRAQTKMPDWSVNGALEMEIPWTGRQLNLLIKSGFYDQLKSTYCCLVTAGVAERFLPGFDRYFLSVSGRTTGWARFDGTRLSALREAGITEPTELVSTTTESGIVIFPPFMNHLLRVPRILGRLGNIWQALRSSLSVARTKLWSINGTRVRVRITKIHRKQFYAAIDAYVVIDADVQTAISFVRENTRILFSLSSFLARWRSSKRSSAVFLPLGFGTVNVFLKDFRARQLESYGLGEQRLCRLTLKRFGRVQLTPLITSIPETVQSCHIDWNSNAVNESQLQ